MQTFKDSLYLAKEKMLDHAFEAHSDTSFPLNNQQTMNGEISKADEVVHYSLANFGMNDNFVKRK